MDFRYGLSVAALCSVLLGGCGMDAEQQKVADHLQQSLNDQGLDYWQVEDIDINDSQQEKQGLATLTTYQVDATLELQKSLENLRYVDGDRKVVVTDTGVNEGKQVTLPATVQLTRLNDEEEAVVTFDASDLPTGITKSGFASQYNGWDVVAVGSDEHKAMLKKMRQEYQQREKALAAATEELARTQVQFQAVKAELAVLEKNAEQVGGLGEPMERASAEAADLKQQVDRQKAARDVLQKKRDRLGADIEKLKG
ncbi:MAG: hypothetical protein R3292_04970 [Alcanivorax sp.]|nr:hypothetical protein [Alcanivorax sp.]